MHPRKACLRGRGEGYWDELLGEIQPNLSGCYSENKVVISTRQAAFRNLCASHMCMPHVYVACASHICMPHVHAACASHMCMPHVHAAFLFLLLGSGHEAGDDAVAKS